MGGVSGGVCLLSTDLNSQYLGVSVIAYRDPVGLRGAPLDLVHLAPGSWTRENHSYSV